MDRSEVATMYQVGLVFQAGFVILWVKESVEIGTCEIAMKWDTAGGTILSGNGFLRTRTVSDDGRFAVFASRSVNLVDGQVDTNANYDIFVFDRALNTTELISHAASAPTNRRRS